MTETATLPAEKVRPSMLVGRIVVHPSSTNPRSRFDEASLKELAASMAPPVGIIEPLVVRPHPTKGEGRYEIVAGERRWRAAAIAGIDEIPVIVRELDDAQVLDLQLIENKHRDDIHPLEEARAMERRIKLDRQLTPKGMAKFIGVSERYVQNRLRYLTLISEAQKLFLDGEFSSGHADMLIRLPKDDQKLALKDGLFSELFDTGDDNYGGDSLRDGNKPVKRLRSVREFDEWLKENIRFRVDEAAQSGLFPEVAAAVAEVLAPASEGAPVATLLEVADSYDSPDPKDKHPPLFKRDWIELKKGDKKCELAQRAVLVLGRDQGRLLTICTRASKCPVHFPPMTTSYRTPSGSSSSAAPRNKPAWEIKMEREQAARDARARLWRTVKPKALAAVKQLAATIKPGPKFYNLVARSVSHQGSASVTTLPGIIELIAKRNDYGADQFAAAVAKPLGLDLKPLFKAAAPKKAKAAKKTTAKKAGKKTAGGRKKK